MWVFFVYLYNIIYKLKLITMLSDHNKYEVRKIISEVFDIPTQTVADGDNFCISYSASYGMLMQVQSDIENIFNIQMGDCKGIKTVSDLYEHLDKLID